MKKLILLEHLSKITKQPKENIAPMLTSIFISLYGASGSGGRFGSANIPFEYSDLFLWNSPAKDMNEDIYKTLEKYVASLPRAFKKGEEPIRNLYLWSANPGNGKTSSAVALLNEFMFVGYRVSLATKSPQKLPAAYFFDVNEFQTLYNTFNRQGIAEEVSKPASITYYDMMTSAKEAPLVVFDDIAVRSATEAFRADLHSVINFRVANNKPSIYTSNKPIGELKTVFDERLYDRVNSNALKIEFKGVSQRGAK